MDVLESRNHASSLGYYVSLSLSFCTIIALLRGVLTEPYSGPFCQAEHCYTYPYHDVTERFPRDYYWMGPAILMYGLYLLLFICIHQTTPTKKQIWTLMALCVALLSTGIMWSNYFLQLTIIQPSLSKGEVDGISLMTQFNPHGVFIALEELGYLLMAISFGVVVPVWENRHDGVERALRWIHGGSCLLAIGSFGALCYKYGNQREYLFEVAVITIDWCTWIVSGFLVSIVLRRKYQAAVVKTS